MSSGCIGIVAHAFGSDDPKTAEAILHHSQLVGIRTRGGNCIHGGESMRYLIFFIVLMTASGCLTPGDKKQWNEAMRDLHGENMKMRGETHTPYENGPSMRP